MVATSHELIVATNLEKTAVATFTIICCLTDNQYTSLESSR